MADKIAQGHAWATACHEAGHAVIGHALERRVRRVTIVPDRSGLTLGHTASYGRWSEYGRYWTRHRQAETAILALFGGVFAEREITGRRHNWTGATSDMHKVADIALSHAGPDADAYLRWLRVKALRMVRHWRPQIEAVADALLVHQELDSAGFLRALTGTPPIVDGLTLEPIR